MTPRQPVSQNVADPGPFRRGSRFFPTYRDAGGYIPRGLTPPLSIGRGPTMEGDARPMTLADAISREKEWHGNHAGPQRAGLA